MAFNVGTQQLNSFNKFKQMNLSRRLEEFNRFNKRSDSPTPFSYLTPTQFAELFPKYYMEKLPDVGGFFKALRTQKELGGEGKTYGPHGNTSDQTAVPSSGARVTNIVKAKEIYDYIRSKGVDHNHAIGIVNNIRHESNFDSGIVNPNDNGGPSGGLFQHHDGRDSNRFTQMTSYVGEGWQKNWKKQIDFALTEAPMKKYLATDYPNMYDASRGFTTTFEVPANKEAVAESRLGTLKGYSDAVSGPPGSATAMPTPGGGGNYEITSSGYVVPKDKTAYSPGNEQQCATLAKGFNPDIGRSSGWSVVPGEIKPGVAVATMRYNLPGGDRTGSGYHSGIAMSAPDKDGNFLLLEQFNGQPPRVRPVNIKYGGGAMGGSTEFGLISSNGKLHTEQSVEALNYGAKISGEENQKIIQNNINSISNGNTAGVAQGVADSGSVSTPTDQPQTNLQQQDTVKSIQTATIGDMFKMVGDLAGFFMRGEGVGGGGHKGHRRGHKGHAHVVGDIKPFENQLSPVQSFLDTVAAGESSGGGYNTINRGTHGKKFLGRDHNFEHNGKKLEEMSIGDVMRLQEGSPRTGRKIFAAGKYQMIPDTMKEAVARSGLGKDTVFNKETQDRLAMTLVQMKPKLYNYLTGKSDNLAAAGRAAAEQWRSFPDPRTGKAIGGGPNKALHSVSEMNAAITSARNEIAARPVETRYAKAPSAPSAQDIASNKPTATVAKAEPPAPPGASYLDQIKSKMSGYYEGFAAKMAGLREKASEAIGSSVAQTPPEFPAVGAKMNEVPLPPHRPTDLGNQPAAAADKHTFNTAPAAEPKQQQPIVADTFLNRDNPQFASPSMERQIKNTMNPSASNEGHSFLPTIG